MKKNYIYVVCQYADDWYEMHNGKVFNDYESTKKYLTKINAKELLAKLDYLERIKDTLCVYNDNYVDLVISYC